MLYRFERIDDTLPRAPLAARRALDAAGRAVKVEEWRHAPIDVRRMIVRAGAGECVEGETVRAILDGEGIASTDVPPAPPDPPADAPPPELAVIPRAAWRALSPLARYALVKVGRGEDVGPEDGDRDRDGDGDGGAAARSDVATRAERLAAAIDEIAPGARLSTHVGGRGEVRMVGVAEKPAARRIAVARARVRTSAATVARLRAGDTAKGDVLATARIAAIQAAKRTPDLIPLCHAVALTRVAVDLDVVDDGIDLVATAEAVDRTGVEMEAMVAASVGALTLYDMLKGVDRGITFEVALERKEGGKSGTWIRERDGGGS